MTTAHPDRCPSPDASWPALLATERALGRLHTASGEAAGRVDVAAPGRTRRLPGTRQAPAVVLASSRQERRVPHSDPCGADAFLRELERMSSFQRMRSPVLTCRISRNLRRPDGSRA